VSKERESKRRATMMSLKEGEDEARKEERRDIRIRDTRESERKKI
jgi:hypothetical protein